MPEGKGIVAGVCYVPLGGRVDDASVCDLCVVYRNVEDPVIREVLASYD
jgi:hypothetical protein